MIAPKISYLVATLLVVQKMGSITERYFKFYNHERPHQSLHYKTPSEVHFDLEKKFFDSDGKIIYTEGELKYVVL
jgi:hypothetical protein